MGKDWFVIKNSKIFLTDFLQVHSQKTNYRNKYFKMSFFYYGKTGGAAS